MRLPRRPKEVKRPQRDIPIGILGSLGICTVLYVLVSLVLTGVVNYRELNVPAPVAFAVEKIGPSVAWIKPFIELGALAGLSYSRTHSALHAAGGKVSG